ncbi:hypothetical protein AVEN_189788-1, partial [Araneus ventricosus]
GPSPETGRTPVKWGVVACASRSGGYYAGTTVLDEVVATGHDEN